MTDVQFGGEYVEILFRNVPQLQAGGEYTEILTPIPPPTMGLGGEYVEILTPKLPPTMGIGGISLEVLTRLIVVGPTGSNVYDHTGTNRTVFLLKPGELKAQIVTKKV